MCVFIDRTLVINFFRLLFSLPLLSSIATSLKIESFVEGVMASIASTQPAFILDPDNEPISKWNGKQFNAFICATGDDKESSIINEHIRSLINNDNVDSIFFLKFGQSKLIKNVTETLGILKSKINMIIPYEDSSDLQLRLNSRLYLYKICLPNITLYESYRIRYEYLKNINCYIC